ncbi:MAG: hypothetical protein ABW020_05955 [Candidatus Rokuibacteriota bacterium]
MKRFALASIAALALSLAPALLTAPAEAESRVQGRHGPRPGVHAGFPRQAFHPGHRFDRDGHGHFHGRFVHPGFHVYTPYVRHQVGPVWVPTPGYWAWDGWRWVWATGYWAR